MALALKLKLEPESLQLPALNEMFWKWASICNRISIKKEELEDLHPPSDADGIWFDRTQLHQANTDVKDLQGALKKQQMRLEYEQEKLMRRRDAIDDAIRDKDKRDVSPKSDTLFRPKEWVQDGLLKTKYHYERGWASEVKRLQRQIDKKQQTINQISSGRIKFKPTRISLHANSFRIRFGAEPKIKLTPLENDGIELRVVTKPIQPSTGPRGGKSRLRSVLYLQSGIRNLLAYTIDSLLFGLSRSEEMLMRAKAPEKVEKKNKKMEAKRENFEEKLRVLERNMGRSLTHEEKEIIQKSKEDFFERLNHTINEDYRQLLEVLSKELENRPEYLYLKKYPILLRSPKPAYKHKRFKNVKPDQWEYYIQFGYEPLLEEASTTEPKTLLGIDRGLTHLLALSIFDPKTGKFITNKLFPNPIKSWKWKQRKLKRSIQHLERRIRAQKNEHIPENQKLRALRGIENKVLNHLHEVSREIVDLAAKYNSTIVIEDLAAMKQHGRKKNKRTKGLNYALSLFDYGRIAQLIDYKSKMKGIPLYTILAPGTSQNCAKCLLEGKDSKNYERGIDGNLKRGRCKTCSAENPKSEIDADLNAARVIALCYHKNINKPMRFGERYLFKK